jgi:hypothetical protein
MRKALTLDLSYFEVPPFYDKLQNAHQESDMRPLLIIKDTFATRRTRITLGAFNPLISISQGVKLPIVRFA